MRKVTGIALALLLSSCSHRFEQAGKPVLPVAPRAAASEPAVVVSFGTPVHYANGRWEVPLHLANLPADSMYVLNVGGTIVGENCAVYAGPACYFGNGTVCMRVVPELSSDRVQAFTTSCYNYAWGTFGSLVLPHEADLGTVIVVPRGSGAITLAVAGPLSCLSQYDAHWQNDETHPIVAGSSILLRPPLALPVDTLRAVVAQ